MHIARFSEKLELYLLCFLLFVLPTLESPKALALLLYTVVWAGRHVSWSGLIRFRPDRVELALFAMLAIGVLSTVLNWPYPNGSKGALDTLRNVILFWCIYRAGYSEPQLRLLGYAIVLGVLLGLGYGVVEVLQGKRGQLEFHSAGIVTQSAIYLGMAAVAGTGFVIAGLQERETAGRRLGFWVMATVVMVIGIFVMGSRGSMVAFAIIVLLLLVVMKQRRLWYAAAIVFAVAAALVVMLPSSFNASRAYNKLGQTFTQESLVSADMERMHVWRLAMAHLKRGDHFWFGVGPKNFLSIDAEAVPLPEQLRPGGFRLTHAHNMFLNKFVEEGIFGLGALLMLFGLVAVALIRGAKPRGVHSWTWIAALGALLMPAIAGSFNTPFYQEHAMLAMALMAIYLGSRRIPGVRGAAG